MHCRARYERSFSYPSVTELIRSGLFPGLVSASLPIGVALAYDGGRIWEARDEGGYRGQYGLHGYEGHQGHRQNYGGRYGGYYGGYPPV